MRINFYKYHGTGNDFILIDNREELVKLSNAQVSHLCNRHFGIGADGLMYLQEEKGYDFKMIYYNSDGRESTMCGNGGRCIVALAHTLGLIENKASFLAIDGPHRASIEKGVIHLEMQDVGRIEQYEDHAILNTGSPHYVLWVEDVAATKVFERGRAIRNEKMFEPNGVNVNFAKLVNDILHVRTYERGVEDETLSCGTGVVASAIASIKEATGTFTIPIHTPGGELKVSFIKNTAFSAKNVVLSGPASFVFKGEIELL